MAQIQERTTLLAGDTMEITRLILMTACSSNLWMKTRFNVKILWKDDDLLVS